MIEYKGYIGAVNFDPEIDLFHGTVINTTDVITFYGASVTELRAEMQKSVEGYVEFCREQGKIPEKPFSKGIFYMTDLKNTIAHILEHKQHLAEVNEATIQQYVVLPILRALGWDDTNLASMEVLPEYKVESRRADYALHIQRGGDPKVLIECKRWGQPIAKNEEQICFYAYSGNVPLAIITNGKLWRFYLSRWEASSLSDRIFCETDIENRENAVSDLERYLLKSNIASGEAELNAEIALKEKVDKPKGRTKFTKTQIEAVASQCWWNRTSRKRLAANNGLTEEQVDEVRATPEYREAVVNLMVEQRPEPREFADWYRKESAKPEWMAGRMGLDVKVLPAMFKDAKAIHAEKTKSTR